MKDEIKVAKWILEKLWVLFVAVALLVAYTNIVYAEPDIGVDTETEQEADEGPQSICPTTLIKDNARCMDCHAMMLDKDGKPYFGLKEVPLDAAYEEKPYHMDIIKDHDGKLRPFIKIQAIQPSTEDIVREVGFYIYRRPELGNLIIELQSPGGSVFSAWRVVGVMEEMRAHGVKIETRCYGFGASAAFVIFVAGDVGSRYVNRNCELMTHKLWQFRMFSIDDPDTSEDKAALMKHFQKNINSYILKRTKLTKEIIEEKTYKRDWWMTGEEALEYGVADHFID